MDVVGCATARTQDTQATERLLATAGFQKKMADTPEKVAHLQALPPGRIIRRERNGAPSYIYADSTVCKCLYAGTEEQYQGFRKIAREQTNAVVTAAVSEEASDDQRS